MTASVAPTSEYPTTEILTASQSQQLKLMEAMQEQLMEEREKREKMEEQVR